MTNVIKQILQAKGISQNKLSHITGIPTSNISLIVNGRLLPGPSWRARLAAALDLPEDVLFPKDEVK